MTEQAHVREVGLRDGLQSIAEILPTEQKIAWLDAEHRRRRARDRGQLVRPAEACCRNSPMPRPSCSTRCRFPASPSRR